MSINTHKINTSDFIPLQENYLLLYICFPFHCPKSKSINNNPYYPGERRSGNAEETEEIPNL